MQPTLAPAPHPMRQTHAVSNLTLHQNGLSLPPPLVLRAMADEEGQHGDHADQNLREQLLASVQQHGLPAPHRPEHHQLPNPAHPHHHNIDPAIAGTSVMHANPEADDGGEIITDGRKGKRELSTSKRAAQNRAAQRAFRQRKEGHIKSLEQQVREYNVLNDSFKSIQAENDQLRAYIISLQSRLIESRTDYPAPPTNVTLKSPHFSSPPLPPPRSSPPDYSRAPTAPMQPYVSEELQVSAAQAVAEHKHRNEEASYANNAHPPKKSRLDEVDNHVNSAKLAK